MKSLTFLPCQPVPNAMLLLSKCHVPAFRMPHFSIRNAALRGDECFTWVGGNCGICLAELWHFSCRDVALGTVGCSIPSTSASAFSGGPSYGRGSFLLLSYLILSPRVHERRVFCLTLMIIW